MIKFLKKANILNITKPKLIRENFFININNYSTKLSSTSNLIKPNFQFKINDDELDDEDFKYLKEKELSFDCETNKIKAIKTLVHENYDLKKQNDKLKYRIEHLLNTINYLEDKLRSSSNKS